jgi:hypothetical protein
MHVGAGVENGSGYRKAYIFIVGTCASVGTLYNSDDTMQGTNGKGRILASLAQRVKR